MKEKNIKPFSIDGVAKDQESIIRLRGELESRILEDMRGRGYVPVLDITPELYWEYQTDTTFKYLVVIYGTYIGKKKAKITMGMLGHHPIMFEPNTKQYETKPE